MYIKYDHIVYYKIQTHFPLVISSHKNIRIALKTNNL